MDLLADAVVEPISPGTARPVSPQSSSAGRHAAASPTPLRSGVQDPQRAKSCFAKVPQPKWLSRASCVVRRSLLLCVPPLRQTRRLHVINTSISLIDQWDE